MQKILGLFAEEKEHSLSEILEKEVDEKYLISPKSIARLYSIEGRKIFYRCACPGRVACHLSGLPVALLRIRKMTPLEYERAMGFPDGWTDIDIQCSETPSYRKSQRKS